MLVGWQLLSTLGKLNRTRLGTLALNMYSAEEKKVVFKRITDEKKPKPVQTDEVKMGTLEKEANPISASTFRMKPWSGVLKRSSVEEEQEPKTQYEDRRKKSVSLRLRRDQQPREEDTGDEAPKKVNRRRNEFLEERSITTYKYTEREIHLQSELSKLRSTRPQTTTKDFPLYRRPEISQLKPQPRPMDSTYIKKAGIGKQLTELFKKVAASLITDTPDKQLSNHLEPTFELEIRRKIRAMTLNNFKFATVPIEAEPKFTILEVMHIKGVNLIRNHNFTAEEYVVDRELAKEGYIEYLPHLEADNRYPEVAFNYLHKMVLSVKCLIGLPCSIAVTTPNGEVETVPAGAHCVQFETQLRQPPVFADLSIEKKQYIESYRLLKNSWVITDINSSNSHLGFDYTPQEKEQLCSRLL